MQQDNEFRKELTNGIITERAEQLLQYYNINESTLANLSIDLVKKLVEASIRFGMNDMVEQYSSLENVN